MVKVYLDNSELRSRIRNQYGSIAAFAAAAGMNAKTLSKRLDGTSQWDAFAMEKVIHTLHLNPDETRRYFFTETSEHFNAVCRLAALAEKMTDAEFNKLLAAMDEIIKKRAENAGNDGRRTDA